MKDRNSVFGVMSHENDLKNTRYIAGYIIAILSGFIFLLLFPRCTSPLYSNFYGADCSGFTLFGRAILSGKVIYRDYFDIKGPVFFFWQAFGQLLSKGRMGAFLLECISMLASVIFLLRLCWLFCLSRNKIIFVFALFYYFYGSVIWTGNTVDELCLPLNIITVYYGIRYIKGLSDKIGWVFTSGIFFGCMLFSKITVAAPLLSVMLAASIYVCRSGNAKRLLKAVLLFLTGCLVIAVPVFVYYYSVSSFGSMLEWCFRRAILRGIDSEYIVSTAFGTAAQWQLKLFPCYYAVAYGIIRLRKKDDIGLIITVMSVAVFVSLQISTMLPYYLAVLLPLLMLTVICFCRDIAEAYVQNGIHKTANMMTAVFSACCISLTASVYFGNLSTQLDDNFKNWINNVGDSYLTGYNKLVAEIPEEERDDVFCYNSCSFFEANGLFPANRYPLNQLYFYDAYPDIREEIIRELEERKYRWVYMEQNDFGVDPEIMSILNSKYNVQDVYGFTLVLWKRKDV